ncbi:Fungal transcriptional regulatory protein [Penicillium ucsense]|uniref:Fungal transcriptional regulatory protein n=1 Tax=Penicillium ucsense TaxID=2839758 RepID=A0A8J8WKP2_9EURO|nr:Fungal transcriptional regulatory protein [Penicillium ucsense]KAF7738701.1 Fungal transcriptional regulatory protein [Penicillium ucsense]
MTEHIQHVQLSTASQNRREVACQACYLRKKRCVTSPNHSQCTYCFREGQDCLPRKRPTKYTNSQSRSNANTHKAPASTSVVTTAQDCDTRRPYLETEVPPWSAMYSMVSEALRLIPPEDSPSDPLSRKRPASERDEEDERDQTDTETDNNPEGRGTDSEEDKPSRQRKKSCSIYEAISARHVQHIPTADKTRWTAGETWNTAATRPGPFGLIAMNGNGESAVNPKSPGTGAFLGELDALLRF